MILSKIVYKYAVMKVGVNQLHNLFIFKIEVWLRWGNFLTLAGRLKNFSKNIHYQCYERHIVLWNKDSKPNLPAS
jgi:hypothetical protein